MLLEPDEADAEEPQSGIENLSRNADEKLNALFGADEDRLREHIDEPSGPSDDKCPQAEAC